MNSLFEMWNFRLALFIASLGMPWVAKGEDYVVSSVSAQHSFFFSYVKELIKRTPNKTLSIVFHQQDVVYVSCKPYKRCVSVPFQRMEGSVNEYCACRKSFLAKLIVRPETYGETNAELIVKRTEGKGRLHVKLKHIKLKEA